MSQVTVVAQPFTVIRGHHHGRLIQQTQAAQPLYQSLDLVINVGHLTTVGADHVGQVLPRGDLFGQALVPDVDRIVNWTTVLRRRLVGIMRIEVMHPDEEGVGSMLLDPSESCVGGAPAPRVKIHHLTPPPPGVGLRVEVVGLESAVETPARV